MGSHAQNIAPAPPCSCGCAIAHKIAQRFTCDNVRIELWSDGSLWSGMGFGIKGIGIARSNYEAEKNVEAGWLLFSVVELYDMSEVSQLAKAARKAVRQHSDHPREAMLRYFGGQRIKTMKAGRTFCWEKTSNSG